MNRQSTVWVQWRDKIKAYETSKGTQTFQLGWHLISLFPYPDFDWKKNQTHPNTIQNTSESKIHTKDNKLPNDNTTILKDLII